MPYYQTFELLLTHVGSRVARISKRGGGGVKEWDNCKQPWPEFSLLLNRIQTVYPKLREIFRPKSEIQTVFPPKNRWSQKKKVFTELEPNRKFTRFFRPNHGNSFTTPALKSLRKGGADFIFWAKISLKSTKNVRLCILFRPMSGLEPPPPPLATLLHVGQYSAIK